MTQKTDIRKMSPEGQAVVREIIIRMKSNGNTIEEIISAVGCSARHVSYNLGKVQQRPGETEKELVISADRRGRAKGDGRTLSCAQEKKIQKIITDKYPDQLQFDFALWTREAVGKLIQKEYGIRMPARTAGEYLKRRGYTPQKPVKYSYERNTEEVKKWLGIEYPHIKRCAERAKGEIYWGDETGISTSDIRGRGYAPEGKTPVVKRTGKREHITAAYMPRYPR